MCSLVCSTLFLLCVGWLCSVFRGGSLTAACEVLRGILARKCSQEAPLVAELGTHDGIVCAFCGLAARPNRPVLPILVIKADARLCCVHRRQEKKRRRRRRRLFSNVLNWVRGVRDHRRQKESERTLACHGSCKREITRVRSCWKFYRRCVFEYPIIANLVY